jgi:hypothetical protein
MSGRHPNRMRSCGDDLQRREPGGRLGLNWCPCLMA